jgi:cation diffusion facilitator CzcD-associated flavoprotein CzcO
LLAVAADPNDSSFVYVAEAAGTVKRVNVDVCMILISLKTPKKTREEKEELKTWKMACGFGLNSFGNGMGWGTEKLAECFGIHAIITIRYALADQNTLGWKSHRDISNDPLAGDLLSYRSPNYLRWRLGQKGLRP